MKASVAIVAVLAFVCTTTRTAHADADPVAGRAIIVAVSIDLQSYWTATLTKRLQSYAGPRGIAYYSTRIETPCGRATMRNARYCPTDNQIYLDETWINPLLAVGDSTPVAILAHEWGHEVQSELGDYDRSSERPYLRALELQADCYAGLFLRSEEDTNRLDASSVADARKFFFSAGDPSPKMRSHGTGPQRLAWFNAGYRSGDLDVCASVFKKEHAMPRIPSE
jgi:predicted metalloprotease